MQRITVKKLLYKMWEISLTDGRLFEVEFHGIRHFKRKGLIERRFKWNQGSIIHFDNMDQQHGFAKIKLKGETSHINCRSRGRLSGFEYGRC